MKRFWKRSGILAVLFLFLCSATALAGIKKGPYLMYEGSNTGMAVLWQTDVTESDSIRWGTDTSYSLGQATSTEYGDHQHKFVITGLQPGTKYYYQLDGYGSGSFHTAPPSSATSVKFFAYGDTRTYPANQEWVVSTMRLAYSSDPAFQTITLHSGDWVGGDTETDWTTQFFVNTNPQMHAFQAEVPIQGVRGNHEGIGTYYKKYFPYPYVSNFYWSYDYGPVHVVELDQYASYAPGSPQHAWLTNDLASTTKPWKIIVLHEPGWTSGGSHGNNASVQAYIQPLAKQYGVDFIIGGHNHYYSRAVVDGVQHITTGGGGAPLSSPASGQPYIVTTDQSYHYCEFDIQNNTLILTARRADGSAIETVTVTHTTNSPPVADAGPDQTVTDVDGNGSQSIGLDGSASHDSDGSIASYTWAEGSTTIATGPAPTVTLPVGTHSITLTVTDNLGATATDLVVVTVQAPTVPVPGAFSLLSPSNRATQVSRTPYFDWTDAAGAVSYTIVVSRNSSLSSPVIGPLELNASNYASLTTLASKTKYYWRVTAANGSGSTQSAVFSFTTKR